MASRLPRCLARLPIFVNGAAIRNPAVGLLLQRRAFSVPPPPTGSIHSQPEKPEMSKHIAFYKEFGRPISKVFLMAFFTYQALYWLWLKLERGEEQREKEKEVQGLMAEVEKMQGGNKWGK